MAIYNPEVVTLPLPPDSVLPQDWSSEAPVSDIGPFLEAMGRKGNIAIFDTREAVQDGPAKLGAFATAVLYEQLETLGGFADDALLVVEANGVRNYKRISVRVVEVNGDKYPGASFMLRSTMGRVSVWLCPVVTQSAQSALVVARTASIGVRTSNTRPVRFFNAQNKVSMGVAVGQPQGLKIPIVNTNWS